MPGNLGLGGLTARFFRLARVRQIANPVLEDVLGQLWHPVLHALTQHSDSLRIRMLQEASSDESSKLEDGIVAVINLAYFKFVASRDTKASFSYVFNDSFSFCK